MTRGSWIHDEVRRHFGKCAQCTKADPESARLRQPEGKRHVIPSETALALCPVGRTIYQSYLRWLREDDA